MKWRTVYPRSGGKEWFHIRNLIQLGEVYEYILDNYPTETIVVITVCGNDTRRWDINAQQKAETLYWYLQNNINTNDLKLRLRVRE